MEEQQAEDRDHDQQGPVEVFNRAPEEEKGKDQSDVRPREDEEEEPAIANVEEG